MMKLENDVIRLRAAEPADIDLLYLWENDPDVWNVSENLTPYSRFELEKYVLSEGDIFANRQLRLMIDCKQNSSYSAVGTVDLFDFNPAHRRAGVGILIYAPENRRKGYASEALNMVVRYAFNILNIDVLYCNIPATNLKSIKCFKKAGFVKCGHKKSWINTPDGREDEIMLQLIKEYNDT
jgi:diamine N-acetyltransferase